MSRIELKRVVTLEQLRELRPAWNRLLAESLRPTVFATWEWQYLCAKMFAESQALDIVTAYSGDELVAVLPMRLGKFEHGGPASGSAMCLLGGGITDYNVFVVRKKYLSSVVPVMADYLKRCGRAVDFENILPGSPPDILRRYLMRHGFRRVVYESKIALAARLSGDYDSFRNNLKKKFQKAMRNNRNYMERAGGYSYHAEEAAPELLEALISLHTARWEDKGESGALARQKIKDFHASLHEIKDRPFDIKYYTIRHEGKIVAILYGFIMNDVYYAYLSGFDATHNRISPGNMIIDYCIRELSEAGIRSFDLLRGDMKYKQTWANVTWEMQDTICFPPTIGGWLRYLLMKLFMALKRLLPASLKVGLKSMARRED